MRIVSYEDNLHKMSNSVFLKKKKKKKKKNKKRYSKMTLAETFTQSAITKTCIFKYTENFLIKNENLQIKKSDIYNISAQNIDCGYSLEPS